MREGYLAYCPMPHDRPCWDLTATLYAVEGGEWFTVSEPGKIEVRDDGVAVFVPDEEGRCRRRGCDEEGRDGRRRRAQEDR